MHRRSVWDVGGRWMGEKQMGYGVRMGGTRMGIREVAWVGV